METLKNINLNDKLYEKRKLAALEVEKIVRDYVAQNQPQKIHALIRSLTADYCQNGNPNARNGGLIGLAAVAIALSTDNIGYYLNEVCAPVLQCMTDTDARVRYYACEAMYNICKVAKQESLLFFNEIFDSLSKLSADGELSVKNGAELLDRLLKDIVTFPSYNNNKTVEEDSDASNHHPLGESHKNYSQIIERFIPLLSERIYTVNPFTRSFLISWLSVLDSVPEMNLLQYLPNFLDGLFGFLDEEENISVTNLLSQFLTEINSDDHPANVDFDRIISILIPHTRNTAADQPKLIALTWLSSLMIRASSIHTLIPSILTSVLPSLSHNAPSIKRYAKLCNMQVQTIAMESQMEFSETINALRLLFLDKHEHTRVCVIEWLILIHSKDPSSIIQSDIISVLLNTLSDESDLVVSKDLELIALIAKNATDEAFSNILGNLMKLLWSDVALVESRGALILRSLCYHLDSERVFIKLASILDQDMAMQFTTLMVQNLGILLVTADETASLRQKLKSERGGDLFDGLYKCWSHNPVSLFSLCLLSERYEHAFFLIQEMANEVSLPMLVQFDKLVQLLESPVFTCMPFTQFCVIVVLRLQLLDAQKYPFLIKSLYGVLMLLPQSSAFATLRNRLNTVSQNNFVSNISSTSTSDARELSVYLSVRARHNQESKSLMGSSEDLKQSEINQDYPTINDQNKETSGQKSGKHGKRKGFFANTKSISK